MFSPLTLSGASPTLLSSQPSVFSAVSIVPGGTGSNSLSSLEPRQFSLSFFTYQEALSGTSTTSHWCKRNCIGIVICHCSLFPLFASCDRIPTIPPQLLHFRSCILSQDLSHPSICFSHSPINSFLKGLGFPLKPLLWR